MAESGRRAERPCEATIDLDALRANAAQAKRLAGRRELIAVVKADAYGHGAPVVARSLLASGCSRLAVLTVAEGVALRDAGIDAPILILAGARDADEAEAALAHRLTPVVHDRESLERVAAVADRVGAAVPVHVEVDTGMQRMGVPRGDAPRFLAEVSQRQGVSLEGVFTHFARADEPDLASCFEQIAHFRQVLDEAKALGVAPALVHADNSAALMAGKALREAFPEATAVRPGLMLYGVRPAPHLELDLRPVMTLRASVVAVRDVPAGETVGYGGTFRAPEQGTRVATLAVGYADGIPWSAGNRGQVWLAGARRPIAGRVSMDSIGVDIGPGAGPGAGRVRALVRAPLRRSHSEMKPSSSAMPTPARAARPRMRSESTRRPARPEPSTTSCWCGWGLACLASSSASRSERSRSELT